MANIEKRGDSYRITVSCGYGVDGKKKRAHMTWKPDKGMTERQIKKELERQAVLFEERCSTGGVASGAIKFESFAEEWFEKYAEKQMKESSITRYRTLSKRVYIALGAKRIDKITTRDIQSFIDNLGEKGVNETKENSGMSPKTIRCYLTFISSIMNYAIKLDMITSNPCQRVTLPPLVQKEREIFTVDEAAQFLELLECEEWRYRMFFTLAIYSGMRKGELLGLKWEDIDFDKKLMSIHRSTLYTKDKGIFDDETKNATSTRVIKLPDTAVSVLMNYKLWQNTERVIQGDSWRGSDKIFTTPDGGAFHPDTLSAWFSHFVKKNDLGNISLHSLRHTNATLQIAGGVPVTTVASRLGHATPATTTKIYAHAIRSADEAAADTLQNILTPSITQKKKSV